MATQQDVVKTLLQLIGVTSLFIAAKLEVSVSSFAYHKNVNRCSTLCRKLYGVTCYHFFQMENRTKIFFFFQHAFFLEVGKIML